MSLSKLLATLQAMYQTYWVSHWQAHQHGHHLLFERLYTERTSEIDTLAEKIVGMYGDKAVNAPHLLALQAYLAKEWDKEKDPIYKGLHMEEYFQRMVAAVRRSLESEGKLTLGLDDYLSATASAHETNQYLLGQQAKARLAKNAAAYDGNLGMAEMFKFYNVATPAEEKLMDKLLEANKTKDAWELLKKVTGVNLRDVPGLRSAIRQVHQKMAIAAASKSTRQ